MNRAVGLSPVQGTAGEISPTPGWKRVLDVLFVCALAPIALPLMAVIAFAIRSSSPGPVFFRQERVGLRGRRFTCLKFRSMVAAADTRDHQKHLQHLVRSGAALTKLDSTGDTRLIRCGSLMRATGLDELPQLFNILRGDMSMVGPRPCVPYEYDLYDETQKQRFNVVPGLTGLWQVNGKNKTTFAQMIQMDLHYASHRSLWLDLRIILRTFPALIQQTLDWRKQRSQTHRANTTLTQPKQIADSI